MKKMSLNKTFKEMTAVFDEMLASLSTLHSLGSIELRSCGEAQLLREALAALVENYGVEGCSLFLLNNGRLEVAATAAWKDGHIQNAVTADTAGVTPLEVAFAQRVLAQQRSLACDDSLLDPQLQPLTVGAAAGTVFRSLLGTPLLVGGEPVGVLSLSHPDPQTFGIWPQRFIPLFALFLGQSLTVGRLLQDLEAEVKERTGRLERVLEETRHLKEHYQSLSLVDALTGLYNRRFFFSEGHMVVARAARYRHPASFLLVDLDDFKRVNDRFGHNIGDMVLKDVAKALHGQLRDTDILARIGGEEFALILPETGLVGARELGERLLAAVRGLSWMVDGRELRVTFSAGLATLGGEEAGGDWARTAHEDLLETLFAGADKAMYAAKAQGGDRLLHEVF